MFSSHFLAGVAALASLLLVVMSFLSRKSSGPLPPGPKPKPIIGNLLDMPQGHMEQVFAQWRDRWGDVMHHIPAISTIFSNIWLFMHDPDVYTDPLESKTDRYLKTETHEPEQGPRAAVFGFGRRICPGIDVAEASIYVQCAAYLSASNITKALVSGAEVTTVAETIPGVIRHPEQFVCSIKPRSVALILSHH